MNSAAGRPLPLATIAIPTFNRSASLRRALASALAQDYAPLEILVVDNASTDDTAAVCAEIAAADMRVRCVRHPQNLGASRNFNAALQLARGEYFMWLADDDWISANYLSVCIGALEDDPALALAGGAARFPDEPDRAPRPPLQAAQPDPEARALNYLWSAHENSIFYGVYRRPQISQVRLKNILAGDWATVAAIATVGTIATLPQALIWRSSGGASRGHASTVRSLGLPRWQRYAPKLSIAANVAAYFWREYPFPHLDGTGRRRLARRVLLVLLARKRALRWLLLFVPAALRPERIR